MNSVDQRLANIFKGNFRELDDVEDIFAARMETVEEWDSLSHMNLMLQIIDEFNISTLKPEDFVRMTSFAFISKFLKENN